MCSVKSEDEEHCRSMVRKSKKVLQKAMKTCDSRGKDCERVDLGGSQGRIGSL